MSCWVWFANLLRIFASIFNKDVHLYSTKMNQTTTTYSSKILAYDFLCSVFDLGIREMVASQSVFRSVPSTSVFWKSLSRIGISFCMSGRIPM